MFKLPRSHRHTNRQRAGMTVRMKRMLRWAWRLALLILLIDFFYLLSIWPDWDGIRHGRITKSSFIHQYEIRQQQTPGLPKPIWQPVPLQWIPRDVRRAVIAAEDARFYQHNGFDLIAFKEAMDTNLELGELRYGASTISQQTIKNLYFSPSRNPLRKWHELVLTLGMEMNLSKNRILETYLNIAEFGQGVYGVEAAARHYWGVSVQELNEDQAAELAATLPSPVKHNPQTRTKRFLQRRDRILDWMFRQQQQ